MEKIVVEWQGIVLMEPMALFLNWILSIQCFIYYSKSSGDSEFSKNWQRFFLLFCLSTFFGGLSHLLFHYTGMWGKIPGWSLAIGAIFYMQLAVFSVRSDQHKKSKKALVLYTALLFVLLAWDLRFLWVTIYTSIGLLFVLGINSWLLYKKDQKEWKGYLIGIGWMLFSLPFMIGKIDLHQWFNRHDISHLLMLITLYYFYATTKRLSLLEINEY